MIDVTDAGFEVSGRHRTEHEETDEEDPATDSIPRRIQSTTASTAGSSIESGRDIGRIGRRAT